MVELAVEIAGAERVDELRGLWLALHHHQKVASLQPLVADDALSWQQRRMLYQQALSDDGVFLVMATDGSHHGPTGRP